jgi:hypothetical protein
VDLATADRISSVRDLWAVEVPTDNPALLERDIVRLDAFRHVPERRSR